MVVTGGLSFWFGRPLPYHSGKEGWRTALNFYGLPDNLFRVQIQDLLTSDERVVVLARVDAQRAGKAVQNGDYVHVCRFKDGRLSEAWIVNADPYEIDDFFA